MYTLSNVQFWLNAQEEINISTKLNCRNDKIGAVLKSSLLEKKNSPNYRNLMSDISENDVTDELKKKIVEDEKEKIIDQFLIDCEPTVILDRMTKVQNQSKFTPNSTRIIHST